jgi:beta-glucosidase
MSEPFLWGTATSAYQVEGGNVHCDWFEHERRFTRAGAACDFENRFEEDLDRARALGTNAFRLSIEWSRVEPREGERDAGAVRYYERLLEACRERGLRPIVTLVQFTLPLWCSRRGGWLAPSTLEAFERHTAFLAERLSETADLFVTINEPNVLARAGYVAGVFPPGRRLRPDLAERCEAALAEAHVRASRVLHETIERREPRARVRVGVSPHVVAWQRSPWDPLRLVEREGARFNWGFLDALAARGDRLDFVGMNYFMSMPAHLVGALRFAGALRRPVSEGTSDMGWPVSASGFEAALLEAHRRYGRPILVTENGVADARDAIRPVYLAEHVAALERAVARGARVTGYCHWSLVDNFEWHEGYGPRFGLYAVDYATQERTLRPSGELYRRIIRERTGAAVLA